MMVLACSACCDDQITGWPAAAVLVSVVAMSLAVLMFIAVVTWDVIRGS